MNLPDMSVIDTHLPSNTMIRGYTAEQMLAWGKACGAQEREECAKVCEGRLQEGLNFEGCATAIRARGTT